ncbi:phytoene desaturase family protein [Leeuwenhoekiella sp. UBA1003]|uniref:phytoene desaturase family protein n=1 Tax=Leeuwenhoekiella sp. UBA1003 TaxID=1946744 RepID=UPI0025C67836|nr:phytoene desaturase family protein [Leeuwenhoekiella sp. UBA1003]
MSKKIAVLGSGFSALSAASYLAKAGHEVHIYEKNSSAGGRARQLKREGFTFDMGPSWYWMPDVFERFFNDFGKTTSDYYQLEKLGPAYRVYFGENEYISIADTLEKIKLTFENEEAGSGAKLQHFIDEAGKNYDVAIKDLVYRPGVSPLELVTPATIKKIGSFFSTISKDVRKSFKNPKLIQILEFPVLFLGAKPQDTPSFYSFMNYADFGIGTFHPKTGMHAVVDAMTSLAKELGVQFHFNAEVSRIRTEGNKAVGIEVNNKSVEADIVLSGVDYHHTETLLPQKLRQYSEEYWESRVFAPSSLLFYVGFDKKVEHVDHHTLFFDVDFEQHARDIYDQPEWPDEPLFYANFPSKTDATMAPDGKEAGFFLIPLAPGLYDSQELRDQYFDIIINRLERITGQKLKKNIIFRESFCVNGFKEVYHSYKGNAYGMANTLLQTAFLRPKLKSKKVANLYFTGQLTVPGPGVPPALISGKLTAGLITKKHN